MSKKVILEFEVKAGNGPAMEKLIGDALPDTRRYDGRISIDVMRDSDDPDKWALVEHWESQAHHETYIKWRVETGWFDKFTAMLTGEPAARYFDPVGA